MVAAVDDMYQHTEAIDNIFTWNRRVHAQIDDRGTTAVTGRRYDETNEEGGDSEDVLGEVHDCAGVW